MTCAIKDKLLVGINFRGNRRGYGKKKNRIYITPTFGGNRFG